MKTWRRTAWVQREVEGTDPITGYPFSYNPMDPTKPRLTKALESRDFNSKALAEVPFSDEYRLVLVEEVEA